MDEQSAGKPQKNHWRNRTVLGIFVVMMSLFLACPVSKWANDLQENWSAREKTLEQVNAEKRLNEQPVSLGRLCSGIGDAQVCRDTLLFQGPVDPASMGKLRAALDAHPMVKTLCLDSNGGENNAAHEMADELRRRAIQTCVAPMKVKGKQHSTACGSACSTLWLGGQDRILAREGAFVGVHAPYSGRCVLCALQNWRKRDLGKKLETDASMHLGDRAARAELWNKGISCGPDELYRVLTDEASRLSLVSATSAAQTWNWNWSGEGVLLPEDRGKRCEPVQSSSTAEGLEFRLD